MQLMFCVTGTSRNFLNIFLKKILKLLLLQNINTILYDFMLSNLQINIVNVNFNKRVETLTVQWSYTCTVFILNTHPINSLSKAGAALVNTISSIEEDWRRENKGISSRL